MMNIKNNAWKVWVIVLVLLVLPGMAGRVMAEDWTDPTRLPQGSGIYRLTTDVTMSDWYINGDSISLELNGHTLTITGETGIAVQMDGMLQITDAKGGGIIRFTGSGALKVSKGKLHLDSGTIEGNIHLQPSGFGSSSVYARLSDGAIRGSVYFDQGSSTFGGDWSATMEMLGGTITCSNGSCVQMNDKNAVFNMKGGSIKADGVVRTVDILSGTFRQSGGEISLAKNITNGTQGVVLGDNSTAAEDGSFLMTGGSIRGFTGVSGIDSGYAVYLYNGGSVTMTGGEISGNGVGVRLDQNGAFTMTGGTVSGNSVGVFVSNDAKGLNISGSPKITGNSAWNVRFIPNNQKINVSGSGLNSDARIGFWSERISGTPISGVFTSGLNGNYNPDVFTSDVNGYSVGMNTDGEMIFGENISVHFIVDGTDRSQQNLPTGSLIKDLPQIPVPADNILDGWYRRSDYTNKFDFDNDTVYSSNDSLNLFARIVDVTASIGKTKYATLPQALEAAQTNDTVRLLRDVTLDAPIEIKYPINSLTLDLNGKTLTRGLTSPTENGHVIHVTVARTLTIKDSSTEQTGRITGGNTTGNGGGILIDDRGTLVLEGGEISGNRASGKGGGVYAAADSQSHAVVVRGGKIINNTVTNLCLESGKTIAIHQALPDSTNIGVTLADGEGVFAESTGGYNSGRLSAADVKGFVSDNSAYAAGVKADGKAYLGTPVTVTFDTAGQAEAPAAVSVPTGSLLAKPALSVPAGMVFSGWYRESSFTNKWNFNSDTVDAALTLYAKIVNANPVAAINGTNYNTVQDALDEAVSGDTVTLLRNVDIDETLNLASGKNITLDMAGFRIAQDGSGRIINIEGGLTLTGNGKLTGGSSSDKGGAVYLNGGSLTLISGTITGNSSGRGGAVYAENKAVFTMEGGIISGNSGTSSGGAVYLNIGGSDTASGSSFLMKGGTISGNSTTGSGGAVYANLSTFTMEGGAILGNTASSGGAVYLRGSSGYASFTLKDGEISGNMAATGSGGAVYTDINSEFIMEGGTLSDNEAAQHGGAVYASDGRGTAATSFTMKGGTISGNKAGGKGGALAFNYEGSAVIEGGTITGNSAGESGGGIYAHDVNNNEYVPVNSLTIRGGSITGNTVSGAANNVFVPAGKYLSLADSLPSGTSIGISMENGRGVFGQNASGGKVNFNPSDYFSADDSSYDVGLGSGLDNGKAVLGYKVSFDPNGGTGTMADLVASDPNVFYGLPANQFTREGYAFGVWNTAADGSGTSYDLTDSVRFPQSMTLYAQWQTVWQWVQAQLDAGVSSITLPGNATAGPDDQALTTKSGTAVTINLNGYTLDRGNPESSTSAGGFIVVKPVDGSVIVAQSNLTLTGPGTITGGNKDGNGGGIRVESGNLNIGKDVVITGNKASGNGGGIYMNDTSGYLSLTKATVSGNSAGNGGGICLDAASSASISGSTISGNTASDSGGGINAATAVDSLSIDFGSLIENNIARTGDGGGIYSDAQNTTIGNFESMIAVGSPLSATDPTVIRGNAAQNRDFSDGGGIYTYSGSLKIDKFCVIENNSAALEGGGIYTGANSNFVMEGGSITGNSTGNGGGGVYAVKSFTMSGGSITGNSAVSEGGGVYAYTKNTFQLSGKVQINGNTIGDSPNNVYLYQNLMINVGGSLEGASVGVHMSSPRVFTSGLPGNGDNSNFFSDYENYAVGLTGAGEATLTESYTVSFNTGSSGITAPADQILGSGVNVTEPTLSSEDWFYVEGWYKEATFQNKWDFATDTVSGNMTLYAKFLTVWQWVQHELDKGTTPITLPGDAVAGTSDGPLTIHSGTTIDLNGHNIDRRLTDSAAVANGNVIKANGDLTLTDSAGGGTITGGNNTGNGGGIVMNSGFLTLWDVTISGNSSERHGGGIYFAVNGGNLRIMANPVIESNSAHGAGGGIYAENVSIQKTDIRQAIIRNNSASMRGGGIYFKGTTEGFYIRNITISENSAGIGGGIYIETDGPITLGLAEITKNKAEDSGGGIFIEQAGDFTIHTVTVNENTAKNNGGGIYLNMNINNPSVITGETSIQSNTTENGNGGGIYFDNQMNVGISGKFLVSGNRSNSKENNIYLTSHSKFNISGTLDPDTRAGISMENPGVFTSGLSRRGSEANFFSDDPAYAVGLNSREEAYLGTAWTVTFVLDKGGTSVEDPDPAKVTVADGYRITAPTVGNIPEGYGLDSWYTDNTYTTKWDFGNTVSGDMTLYARIREAVASLTYRGNTTLYNSVQEAINAIPQGMYGYFLLTLLQDVTIENGLSIDNQIVYFDLAGHTISVKSNFQDGGVIGVSGGGALTLRDSSSGQTGKIIGGAYDVAGIIVAGSYANYSQFRMEGGTIESFDSSAIYTLGESRIIMSGGRIINNNVNNIYPSDTPGGIYFESTPSVSPVFKLEGGNGVISSNTNGDGNPSNVYLPSGMVIEVTAALTGAEGSIGITMENGTGGVFARAAGTYNGGKLTEADAAVFFSDNPDYTIRLNGNGEAELVRVYTVNFDVAEHGTAPDSQKVLSGGKVTEPTLTFGNEYVLTGWYTDAAYTTPWNFGSDTVSGNITLYGKVEEAAAAIGETGYLTVQAAVDAAQTGETVTLLKDVTIGAPVEIAAGKSLTLDLAGKTIDRGLSGTERGAPNGNVITVNGNLTLANSVGSGRITGGFESSYIGESAGGVIVNPNAVFTLNGGEIYNNKSLKGSGGIYADNATIVMNGGKIRGNNLTANDDGRGAGISLVNGSAFEMNNGEISMNSARYGAGVYLDNSQFTMNNGSVEGNQASYKGGGVYLIGRDSAFTMYGGDITGNYAEGNTGVPEGGGVYVDSGSFILFDGTIHKNGARYSDRSGGNGGGVYITESGNFYIVGGVIQDNSASVNGGGVYFAGATFSVRGGTISGNNNASGSGNNVYLGSGKMLSIPRQPAEGTSISITLANGSGVFAEGSGHTLTAEDKAYFFSDDSQYVVGLNADKRLFLGKNYTVSFNANATEGVTGTMDDQTFIAGEQQALTVHAFHRTGYGFDGWNTVAEPTSENPGTAYDDGQEITITGDLTLYAQWKANVHTVSFIANDSEGSVKAEGTMHAEQIDYGTTKELTENVFTRKGYEFKGWNTASDGTGTSYADKASVTIEDDLTLYTQWELIEYTITYDLKDGELPEGKTNPKGYTVETDDFTLVNPIRTGYSFDGWYDGSTSAQTVTIPKGSTGNRSFEAGIWVFNSYTVRYEPNGGSGSAYTGQFFYDLEQSLMHWNPTGTDGNPFPYTGYRFTAWNTAANGSGTGYELHEKVKNLTAEPNGTVTLYAQWEPVTYSVHFDANTTDPVTGSMADQTFTYNVSQALTANAYERSGYSFVGWNTAANGSGTNYTDQEELKNLSSTQDAVITLYAKWTLIPIHTVTFDPNGGTGIVYTQNVEEGTPTSLTPNTFIREGWTFAGWNTAADCSGTAYADKAAVTLSADQTLYAQWSPVTYSITYHLNGGSVSGTNPDEYTPADAAITLINPTRTGYSFSGWQGTGLSGTVPSVTIPSGSTGNRDYTAVWTANSYTVSFVTNGGTGTMADQRFTYDVPQALSPLGYTREGFTFVGWYTNSDGTGTSYEDGESVRNLTDRNGVTVSLYAVWTEKPTQTITFAPNGGAEAAYHQHVIRGIGTTLSPNQFTRVGYTFGGWNTASNGSGSSYTDGAPVNLLSDLTLYAQWSVNPQPSEPMDLTVDVTNITNTGAKGVPADIAQQILELSIFIKEGDTIVSRADGVSLDVFGRFVKVRALAHFDRKVDFTKGHYTFAVVVTPHEVFSAPPLSQRYSLSAMAWLDNKGEITLYLTWDDGNHSKPELVRIYALPEDEIGAYHILPDGTKEYLLFHTYDICMAWLGRDDLCRGPERCFHKEHPYVNPFVTESGVIEEYWR
ncbi:MAG: InlB B-repeat-containing protein [Anaerolineaceae bacterium]|nr:InlB B-repeat-containing protein [Anaerolineaceae bacterium]